MNTLFLILSSLLFSVSAFAFPEAPVDSLDWQPNFVSLAESETDYDFNGIIKLSNCSGSIIRFTGQPDSSKAYVLTNGHCLKNFFGSFPSPGEVRYRKNSSRRMDAYININQTIRVRASMMVYGTMTNTDVALYRLTSTYAELSAQGVEAFELSSERPLLNQSIQIISGYWKRGFECSIEKFVYELHESDWTMKDSLRYSEVGCEVYGGTSGSPIVAANERLVVGINNTGNESGQQCTTNNPCEVDEQGNRLVIKDRGYGQQTYWFYSCLDENFNIDLNVNGCELPKPN